MRVMAFIRVCLFVAINFAVQSLQDSKDPLRDFCRRWGHQTAQVDGKLYIDGGLIAWNPLESNPLNYTNQWLLYSDLSTSTQDVGMPQQYANLTKNQSVPSVLGGILWADEVNKCFYQFGGEYQNNPADFSFWAYDTVLNQWNESKSDTGSIQRVSFGAGTQIQELGLGYYYGGWKNNLTSPGWAGESMATSNMVTFDFSDGTWKNSTGPDSVGRAEGSMVYIPASDGGLLVYFGGVEDHGNRTYLGANMSTIHIFDVSSSKWYTQAAGGTVPASRRQSCAGVTWADDRTSYNIYLYGGFTVGQNNATAFDDVYILSLPSFTWIKPWPLNNDPPKFGHGGCSANVVNPDQMIVIGGWFPSHNGCDTPSNWGQHNMNLGFNGPASTIWDKYNPKITAYVVPSPVISAVGGGPTGGATITEPSSWDDEDLAVYFTRSPSFSARAATRTVPTGTSDPSEKKDKLNVRAIAGGGVGGLVVLIAVLSLILFCLHRHKKGSQKNALKRETMSRPPPPPVELATGSPIHELSSSVAAKYISMQEPDSMAHPAYSGPNSSHSRSPSDHASPYPSPYSPQYPRNDNIYHQPHTQYHPYSDTPLSAHNPQFQYNSYDPQRSYSQQNSPQQQQQQFPYSSPTSPSHHPLPSQTQQQSRQVYYPPPPEPPTPSRPDPLFFDRLGTSPEGTQYSGDTQRQMPISTSTTPAQFYAQPAPPRPTHGDGRGNHEGHGDAGSMGRESVDSRRRPIQGKFVEVDDM